MDIQFQNTYKQPHFNAHFLNKSIIQEMNSRTKKYNKKVVNFVEFDFKNKDDLIAMADALNIWVDDEYGKKILDVAKRIINLNAISNNNRIFLLTTQTKNFVKLDKNKILGMAHMMTFPNVFPELRYLQVHPKNKFNENKRQYKHIGKSIINSLKKIYSNITLISSYKSALFYEHLGFNISDIDLLKYTWIQK